MSERTGTQWVPILLTIFGCICGSYALGFRHGYDQMKRWQDAWYAKNPVVKEVPLQHTVELPPCTQQWTPNGIPVPILGCVPPVPQCQSDELLYLGGCEDADKFAIESLNFCADKSNPRSQCLARKEVWMKWYYKKYPEKVAPKPQKGSKRPTFKNCEGCGDDAGITVFHCPNGAVKGCVPAQPLPEKESASASFEEFKQSTIHSGGDPDYLRDVPAMEKPNTLPCDLSLVACDPHHWTCEDKRRILQASEDGKLHCILPPAAQPLEKQPQ